MKKLFLYALLSMIMLQGFGASAEWSSVGEGIDYQKFTLPDPNNVYVARMLKNHPEATVESSLPQGKLTGARDTVRSQSQRLDGALSWWGREWGCQNDVIVAINGDWIYLNIGVLYGGQVHSGWYSKRVFCEFGGTQFAWTHGRETFIGGHLNQATQELKISCTATGIVLGAQGLNRSREANELILYTPQYDATTNTDDSGVEVLVEVTQPTAIAPLPKMVTGTVRSIFTERGSTPIPFDHVVLSAVGAATETLIANLSVGSEIGISQSVSAMENPPFDWSDTFASISGGRTLVQGGVAVDNSADRVYASRHPRTAVAYNNEYVYFVVCDGRSAESRGMSSQELSAFLIEQLKVTDALNLDGGGSSTMLVKGEVVNVPSDGSERRVGNGLMMVNLKPKSQSDTFQAGAEVSTARSLEVHLGPGTNYASVATLAEGTRCGIADHALNGVLATGQHWWKVGSEDVAGWVAEDALVAGEAKEPRETR